MEPFNGQSERDLLYPLEKLELAVYYLATGQGDVRSRLLVAYPQLMNLEKEELPEALQADFEWVRQKMGKYQPEPSVIEPRIGVMHATIKRMRNSTGSKIAERIYLIYSRLQTFVEAEHQ